MFLAYASPRGRALIDRELYLPRSWTEDRARCTTAGVPDDVEFATKPEQGLAMLERAHAAGMLNEAYGQNRRFRDWLAARGVPFVLATRSANPLTCPDGRRYEAKALAAMVGLVCDSPSDDIGDGAPFLCLGACEYRSHRGERPIAITWKLRREMPGETFRAASVVAS